MTSLAVVSTGEALSDPIEPGITLSEEASSVYDLAVADAAGFRSVTWIESATGGATALQLAVLSCDDGS